MALPEVVLLATGTTSSGSSLWTPALIAAAIAAVVSLGTFALTARRGRVDRQRQVFAGAFEAVTAYREYPYIVRRRDPGKEADERVRISNALSTVQAQLNGYRARLKIEDAYVGDRYELLVAATRRVAGGLIKSEWGKPGAGADAQVHAADIDMAELAQYDLAYLQAVRDHLGPWWAPARRRLRREKNRATLPEDAARRR